MKIIRARRAENQTLVLKQADGGSQRIRCPKCQQLAVPTRQPDGKTVLQCGGCGAQYQSRVI